MLTLISLQLYALSVITLLFVLQKLIRAEKFRYTKNYPSLDEDNLPTISVCVPARNETNAMTECLERILASDYPKLEVIVLDDNSSDNTSHLIKAFAHGGVRFIKGESLPDGWLGKNYSLQAMMKQSSGKYILFLDVDTRIETSTISKLVAMFESLQLEMLSVIPQRRDFWRASTWFGTLRYFWELILSNKYNPGASSAAWLIKRSYFSGESVGFLNLKTDLQPEVQIAREIAKSGDYRLVASTSLLGMTYEKKWSSQIEASRRILLPRLGNSFVNTLVGAGLLAAIVLPQLIAILAFVNHKLIELSGAIVIGTLAIASLLLYYRLAWTRLWWMSWIVAPIIAWQELFVMIASAVGYYRGTITWKGRQVERPKTKTS